MNKVINKNRFKMLKDCIKDLRKVRCALMKKYNLKHGNEEIDNLWRLQGKLFEITHLEELNVNYGKTVKNERTSN
jgi:hypothetical protein